MKTKLIALTWRGTASVDPRFSAAMLSWSVADICKRDTRQKLSVGIEHGIIEAYNCEFEQQFAHHIKHLVGVCRVLARRSFAGKAKHADFAFLPPAANPKSSTDGVGDPIMSIIGPEHGVVYLLKDPRDPLLHIHFFEGDSMETMTELLHQMRDPSQPMHGGSVGSIPATFIAGHNATGSSSSSSLASSVTALRSGAHSTPASNLKLAESVRTAQHDGSPTLHPTHIGRMSGSKSYTAGLNHSTGTVHTPAASSTATGRNGAGSVARPTAAMPSSALLDISPNNTQFFEVMYVGKIKVANKRVPFTFIDDSLPKFKAYDAQKIKAAAEASARRNAQHQAVQAPAPPNASESSLATANGNADLSSGASASQPSEGGDASNAQPATGEEESSTGNIINTRLSEENKENSLPASQKFLLRGQSQVTLPVQFDQSNSLPLPAPPAPATVPETIAEEAPPKLRDRSASIGAIPVVEQNRTMVFLIGKSDMRLISPDRKQVLLYKDFKDVASCAQGHRNADHFGIICREPHNADGYIGYVFKCQSDAVADDIVGSISQAFHTCSEQKQRERAQIYSCEHCPMLWYHKLCSDIEGLSEKRTQALVLRRVELLSDDEQTVIMAKFNGAEEMAELRVGEQNQFMMMLLRAHCESRQQRHVHDTAENRSEFLNQYLGGSTIFMKAKRSLTSSFDHLLKRKNGKDDAQRPPDAHSGDTFGRRSESERSENSSTASVSSSNGAQRQRAASMSANALFGLKSQPSADPLKSPMMDIFMKVGNTPKENPQPTDSLHGAGSWRQEMLQRVVTPSKQHDQNSTGAADAAAQFMSPRRVRPKGASGPSGGPSSPAVPGERLTSQELRELWRTAIRQTILLRRMERENARLQERHNEHELKKIKLDYDEIIACEKPAADRWESLIGNPDVRTASRQDPRQLLQAIRTGVPRSKRGEVWSYLAEQHSLNQTPIDAKQFPQYNTPYKVLLKSLTEHQHAIFIDLGRTFPNHTYYKAALGIGQLSLFNILKAYSILDPELGYCQGLGFICGVLLLHCDEEEAFNLLKHLMFRRQMRTKYLPDMRQFQLQLYQLSRLIRDHCPMLYAWLDENDVSPTLYAAPWILTVFSSQFPLGFVTRVFDLLFLESPEVIFKVSIALLDHHQDALLQCNGFEEIMDFLKTVVPNIDATILDAVQRKIFTMDIRKQLSEYQVEYNVLQEEIITTNHHLETLKRSRETTKHLETQLQFAQSSIVQLETTRTSQLSQIQTLQSQVQSLDLTVQTLGQFVAQLSERHPHIELPGDIRRICQQVAAESAAARHRKNLQHFAERKIGKSMSVNAQLGFSLKVLEELNEPTHHSASPTASLSPDISPVRSGAAQPAGKSGNARFFDNAYAKIREQQNSRPQRFAAAGDPSSHPADPADMRLPDYVERAIESMSSGGAAAARSAGPPPANNHDSGISTPASPPLSLVSPSLSPHERHKPAAVVPAGQRLASSRSVSASSIALPACSMLPESPTPATFSVTQHPLSNCEDVHFRFNGTTTQLRSLRPHPPAKQALGVSSVDAAQSGADATDGALTAPKHS